MLGILIIIFILLIPDIAIYLGNKKNKNSNNEYSGLLSWKLNFAYWLLLCIKILFILGCILEFNETLVFPLTIVLFSIYLILGYKVARKKLKTNQTLLFAIVIDILTIVIGSLSYLLA